MNHIRTKLLFTFLLSLAVAFTLSSQTVSGDYESIILRAEQHLEKKDFKQAKAEYENALRSNPSASYPKMKLQQIRQFYKDPLDDSRYAQYIAQADQFFNQQAFDKAKEQYENALIIKPEDKYPQQRIKESEEARALLIQKQKAYSRSLAIADSLHQKKEYEQALNEYLYASGLMPSETYPRKKVDEINAIYSTARKQADAYQQAVDEGDQAYMLQDFRSAIIAYRKALQLKPGESYPANMIERIGNSEADQLTAEETYLQVLANADKAFEATEYDNARMAYQYASRLKPEEVHPKDRLAEIDSLLSTKEAIEKELAKALGLGEQYYTEKEYNKALVQFQKALGFDAGNMQVSNRIEDINQILKKQRDLATLINDADKLFETKFYAEAKSKYDAVLLLEPGHEHALKRITEAEQFITALDEQDRNYNQAVALADAALDNKEFETALDHYRTASQIKSAEGYPKSKIESINNTLKKIEDDRLAFETALADADQKFNKGQYPQAVAAYQLALNYKPQHSHSLQRIAEADNLISQAEMNAAYEKAVSEAQYHESNEHIAKALKAWQAASAIKPDETIPIDKISELSSILEAEKRKVREAYEKAIADGNRYYDTKVFDQAIESYLAAATLMPDVPYPTDQINKIRKYIEDRLLVDLVTTPVSIAAEGETKFSFQPVDMRTRRNNYVVVRINFNRTEPSRFFLNYGLGDQRSGGIVVRNPGGKEQNEFIIRVSAQDRWYRVDNNWLSIYAEGVDIELTQLRISSGD